MHSKALRWRKVGDWTSGADDLAKADLVICFGQRALLEAVDARAELAACATKAMIVGCSTGGQFVGDDFDEDSITALALSFERTPLRRICLQRQPGTSDLALGKAVGEALAGDDLAAVFLLADGVSINGSSLIEGVRTGLVRNVPVTGGLAGDGANFEKTFVFGPGAAGSEVVAAIGFYGSAIRVGHGSFGGWQNFGPRRTVTRSQANVLFELDGKPALSLYERYLSPEEIGNLPASALLFPLLIGDPSAPDHEVVRTVLGVDRKTGSMTFAGDIPAGWSARLMHAASYALIAGAAQASEQARTMMPDGCEPEASILISCIGRRLLLGQNVTEELTSAIRTLGTNTPAIGFYSYGEISPQGVSRRCDIHNQTMTITSFVELCP